jgi:hypothetical protein
VTFLLDFPGSVDCFERDRFLCAERDRGAGEAKRRLCRTRTVLNDRQGDFSTNVLWCQIEEISRMAYSRSTGL